LVVSVANHSQVLSGTGRHLGLELARQRHGQAILRTLDGELQVRARSAI
jgi:hypothetical protein